MKRTEMKKHFTSMKAAALTMLLSARLWLLPYQPLLQ